MNSGPRRHNDHATSDRTQRKRKQKLVRNFAQHTHFQKARAQIRSLLTGGSLGGIESISELSAKGVAIGRVSANPMHKIGWLGVYSPAV
jgi:hypothetical protein